MPRAAPLKRQQKGIRSRSPARGRIGSLWPVTDQRPGTFCKTGNPLLPTCSSHQDVCPLSGTAGATDLAAPAPCPFAEEHPYSSP